MTNPEGISLQSLDSVEQEELAKLVYAVALSEGSLSLFAITPDSAPNHPVVESFIAEIKELEDHNFEFLTFHYSEESLFNFLHQLPAPSTQIGQARRIVMAFGLEQLRQDLLRQEMEQLNLGRERIFEHNLVLVFWLNRETFLEEFRRQAADFWDWRGKIAIFKTRPQLDPLLYPYLEWLISENSRLRVSGVMQVNRQVDISLDRIYVSLQGSWEERRSQSFKERIFSAEAPMYLSQLSLGVAPGGNEWEDGLHQARTPQPKFIDELRLETTLEIHVESDTRQQRVTKIVDLADAVRKHTYCLILGDPGAGKTTLLRYLARHFALAQRDRKSVVQGGKEEELGETRLPILFRIADYAERLTDRPDLSLVDYLQQFYRQWEHRFDCSDGDSVANLLLNRLAMGDCLVLLDGLDEVFDQDNRSQVVQQINRLVDEYRNNKFVVTSRIAGYKQAALGSRFQEFTITPMGDEQIDEFLKRWCLAVEMAQRPEVDSSLQERDAEREAQEIVQEISSNQGVRRFAANPLLLTILALIHRNGTRLPQRRVELYQLAVKTLIEDWQIGRNVPYQARHRQLNLVEEDVTALLAPLALRMHEEKPSGVVAQAEVEKWLTPHMAELQGVDEPTALELVRQFLRKVRETTGLFVERAPEMYGFMHLTFEEYFAARQIADNEIDDILKIISPYRNQARWNEPILLALGYLSTDQNRLNRLLKKLFSHLSDYQPNIIGQEIRLKKVADVGVLVWHSLAEGDVRESEILWQDLLFVGQILAEVRVTSAFSTRPIELLVLTYLGLDEDYDDEPIQQLLKRLRGIEAFNHHVWDRLQLAADNRQLSEEQRNRALVAMLYVACGSAGELLAQRVGEFVQRLTPSLFNDLRGLVAELGAEMTAALERGLESENLSFEYRKSLEFVTAFSYLRADNYDQAIEHLQLLADRDDCYLDGFVQWAIAIAYEKKNNYEQGLQYYQQCSDKLNFDADSVESLILWTDRGVCWRSHSQYEKSLECFQQAIVIARQSKNRKAECNLLWHIGNSYQEWKKYTEAIAKYEQSRDLYQQLEKETNIANLWYWLSDCYRDSGKYEQALEAQQQTLAIRQRLEDQSGIALSYYQFGRIYQVWSKYAEAIAHHEQSRDLNQQLGKETNVATQWEWISVCYRDWGKYQQALEARQQELGIRQRLDDQSGIALSYVQLGRIYQAWSKYAEAIAHHEQSRDIYQQLGEETNVAGQWYWISDCYRDWGKYQQALEAQQQSLVIRQRLEDQSWIALSYLVLGRIYQAWSKYAEAIAHHEQSRDIYQQLGKESDVANQWDWISDCYRDWGKYEQALEAQQQDLAIRQRLDEPSRIALAYYEFGRIYQAWSKYAEAIAHHEQSRDIYHQLGKESDVANQWDWISDCYRDWGKYEQALEAQQQDLAIRQRLDEPSRIALAYYEFGRIYQAWSKYAEAIAHHEQSRDLYQQLGKETNVAGLWYWISDCYRDWGKYQQALEAEQQDLAISQRLEDQSGIASAYFGFGRIYQAWSKYAEAITQYEQSRDLYQQLGKESDVANQWYLISDCYRDWGKYEQALEAQQQELAIRQRLDDQAGIASAYFQLGRIYQEWSKYAEAIAQYEQSRDLYQHLGKETNVANQWYWISDCYRDWGKYQQALEAEEQDLAIRQRLDDQLNIADAYWQFGKIYYAWENYDIATQYHQQSRDLYQQLDQPKQLARQLRNIANSQCKHTRQITVHTTVLTQLTQAEQNLKQAIQLNTKGDYQENLAYDHISLSLIYAEQLRHLPPNDPTQPNLIIQFNTTYPIGFNILTTLGETLSQAEESLKIARAYLETPALQNLDMAITLTQQSLETFQTYNRRKLQADALKLLGEIYQHPDQTNPHATETGLQFLTESQAIYQEIGFS
ncbi:tetratricopeptide repeat protein [Lyngbya sp. CCAP 1446/10]|nr:tetratricopeptide repeat protein [Lyngbya sp. CCAP 1446/10]